MTGPGDRDFVVTPGMSWEDVVGALSGISMVVCFFAGAVCRDADQ